MTAGQAEVLPASGTAIEHETVVGPMDQVVGYEAVEKPR